MMTAILFVVKGIGDVKGTINTDLPCFLPSLLFPLFPHRCYLCSLTAVTSTFGISSIVCSSTSDVVSLYERIVNNSLNVCDRTEKTDTYQLMAINRLL